MGCSVKRRNRAIQKLLRSYEGNASRLIDLVRSGIVFKDLQSLAECLKIISKDPRCVILQVKNRFAMKYNSAESAGYRNVALSMVIVDDETMGMSVDKHVCELQMGVEQFESMKSDEGHK